MSESTAAMPMNIDFTDNGEPRWPVLAVGVYSEAQSPEATLLDNELMVAVTDGLRRITACGRFSGAAGTATSFLLPASAPWRRLVIGGLGPRPAAGGPDRQAARLFGGAVVREAALCGEIGLDLDIEALASLPGGAELVAQAGYGARLSSYRFRKWRSEPRPGEIVDLAELRMISSQPEEVCAAFTPLRANAAGVFLARDLVNEPPNILTPEGFVKAVGDLRELGVAIEVLDESALRDLGMGGLLAVGGGSEHRPCLLVLSWNGAAANVPPICLVGKGITFDSGGLQIKPHNALAPMKGDMAGAAAVAGAIMALALRKAETNAVGVIPLAENAVSGGAFRPSDVVRLARGDTVEIVNTDAEGRLVLADAIWYASTRFAPGRLVSLGTLGGSGFFGLGLRHGALYCDEPTLRSRLMEAGQSASELLWHLPADPDLDEDLRQSDVADLLQCVDFMTYGADSAYIVRLLSRSAGTTPWAHIEMARLEFAQRDQPTCPKGATGFGAALLAEAVCQGLA